MTLTLLLASLALSVLVLVGVGSITGLASERRRITSAALSDDDAPRSSLFERSNSRFRRTRLGAYVERELALAGSQQKPLAVTLVGAATSAVVCYVLWTALAPVFGLLGLTAGVVALRIFLARAKERRLEAFITQMPELARVLANATSAGMSIATAVGIAAEELPAPAGSELQRVSNALGFGTDLQTALDSMGERLPSREVAVLLSTLVVCSRSGGSLVTSLRDIADTLEARKETRREVRTILAQSIATSYVIIALGFGMLFILNTIQPGSVEAMTGHLIGQVALVVSGALFALGFVLIRRMARFDL